MPRISGRLRTRDNAGLPFCRFELWAGYGVPSGSSIAAAPAPPGAAPTPVIAAHYPEHLVVANQRTDERGYFSVEYPALSPNKHPFIKYYLEDLRPGQSGPTFAAVKFREAGNLRTWCIRVPDQAPNDPPHFLSAGERVNSRPPEREFVQAAVATTPPSLAPKIHRAVLVYELLMNQRLWFDRQITAAKDNDNYRNYRRYVVPAFIPPPDACFELRQVDAIYVGTTAPTTHYSNNQIRIKPDQSSTEDRYYQFVIPHEYGHHIFQIGHPGYRGGAGRHTFYGDWAHDDYSALALAAIPPGASSPAVERHADESSFVQQLGIDFKEGYASYIGKSFNSRRDHPPDLGTPNPTPDGFGDNPTLSFLWDLSDGPRDGGTDNLRIPFGVIHMLCCKWGDELQAGTRVDVPPGVCFGADPPGRTGVVHNARTLPGFIGYLKEHLLPRYAARIDPLIHPNHLLPVMQRWNELRQAHGLPTM